MRIQTTIVNKSVFIQCYDSFKGKTELESAKYFRDYINEHCIPYSAGELEENECGIYYFEIKTKDEYLYVLDINRLIKNYSKSALIKYFNTKFTDELKYLENG